MSTGNRTSKAANRQDAEMRDRVGVMLTETFLTKVRDSRGYRTRNSNKMDSPKLAFNSPVGKAVLNEGFANTKKPSDQSRIHARELCQSTYIHSTMKTVVETSNKEPREQGRPVLMQNQEIVGSVQATELAV